MREMFLSSCCWIGCFLFCSMNAQSSQAETAKLEPTRGPAALSSSDSDVLVDSDWLASRIRQADIRVLEIGKREQYMAGHIPAAGFVDWIGDITDPALPDRYNVLSRQQLEQLLSKLGVSKNTTLVLYDRFENRLSTRMFWSLRLYGHQRVKILNGGERVWSAANQPVVTEVPVFAQTNYQATQANASMAADRRFIMSHLTKPQTILIDGRPLEQFTGEQPGKVFHTGKEHARRGHLPQSVNIPWQENLTADGRFKSVNELRKIYNDRGVTKGSTIVTYCNEGLHAAHPWFVLTELLGYQQVRLYDDSLSEWANTPDDPLVMSSK